MDSQRLEIPDKDIRVQNLFLLSISLIYFPLFPGISETQPILLFALGGICLLTGRFCVNIYSVLLVYFSTLFLAVLFFSGFKGEYFSELSKLVLVLIFVILAYPWIGFGSSAFYRLFIALHLFIAVMAFLNLTSWLANYFGRYTTLEGGRGISYLASEPSYAATYIFYVSLVYTLGLSKGVFNSRLIQVILMLLLLSTYSLMGFLFFVLILAVDISLGKMHRKIVMGVLAALGGGLFCITVDRVSMELIPLVTSVFSSDEGILRLALDYPSASTRFVLNGVATLDGLQRVLYFPVVSFNEALPTMLSNYGLGPILYQHEVIGALYVEGMELKPQALFPYVVYVFGLLAMPLLFHPVSVAFKVLKKKKYLFFLVCLVLIFIFFFYQSQYVNPIQFFTFIVICKFFEKQKAVV